jgi:rod shape determining protein RodA
VVVSSTRLGERLSRLDLPVLGLTVLLLVLGLVQLSSADLTGQALGPQLRWLLVSLLAFPILVRVSYRRWIGAAPVLYGCGLLALVLVLLVGPTINGSRRWLPVLGLGFQPSELMKIGTVLLLARLVRRRGGFDSWPLLLLGAGMALLPAGLILVQPDLGTSLLFVPLLLALLWVGGAPPARVLGLFLCGVLGLTLLYGVGLKEYQRERILSTYRLDQMTPAQRAGAGYQLDQSLLAIGNGGLFGHGRGEGPRTQSGRLPYQHNDFIFAVLAEEQGFAGCLLVLLLVLALVLLLFALAARLRDPEGRILVVGVGTLLGTQAFIHAGVTLGLLPTKGLAFPFFSAGGTSLFATLAGLALAQSAALHRHRFPIPERREASGASS